MLLQVFAEALTKPIKQHDIMKFIKWNTLIGEQAEIMARIVLL